MPVTVAEKFHWKDRIASRIDRRVEAMVSAEDPGLLQRVSKEANERAVHSLGIADLQRRMERIERQRKELDAAERRVRAERRALVNGTEAEAEMENLRWFAGPDHEVDRAVRQRAEAIEPDILAESELGRRVLALRAEKENLLDTVWLATSGSQIKELWGRVNELLGVQPTALEAEALRIAPEPENGAPQPKA